MEFWTEPDDRLLRDSYQEESYERIALRLGRTPLAIKARAITLKLEPKVPNWTEEEVRFLREACGTGDVEAIAAELGRTRAAVAQKTRRMGLIPSRHESRRNVQRLRALCPRGTARELGDRLGRSFDSVRTEAVPLGLGKQAPPAEPAEV